MKLTARSITIAITALAFTLSAQARTQRPTILVKDSDKPAILQKIDQQPWAAAIYQRTLRHVEPYVQRHETDPEWILSRYLMNREEGKRYTDFEADGKQILKYSGDATVPTVRVAPHIRKIVGYDNPRIEDLIPYDSNVEKLRLVNPKTGEFEWVTAMANVSGINGEINGLAMEASVIYWLTGDERYAKFAADILDQWARGAAQQNPIIGPGRTGYLCHQTLGDAAIAKTMALAYDFLGDYLEKHGYELDCYEIVFEKFARTLAYKGFATNNWYAAESSGMVAAALALEDHAKTAMYIRYYTEVDNNIDGYGQLALPSTLRIWFNEDGHWREPGGYHNYPTTHFIESAIMVENNGYEVIREFPALLRSSYAMVTYSFPNLTAAGYGDTGRARPSPSLLEMGLTLAHKYQLPIEKDILAVMQKMVNDGYRREKGSIQDMLINIPEIPEGDIPPFHFGRSEWLDFARAYYQRNGMDPRNGLMYVVHGSTYNHNHANGMAMELYGKGAVAGCDSGNGGNYDTQDHIQYYAMWAAHNTVVAAGASNCKGRFNGGGGTKQIGGIEFVGVEPKAKQEAVSEHMQFTDSRYDEQSTGTRQRRTMAIVRTAEDAGYYVDIFRSDNPICNDYIYHNEGESLALFDAEGKPAAMQEATYPTRGEDIPGMRFFTGARTTGATGKQVMARFTAAKAEGGMRVMNVWMPASEGKSYYAADAPALKTALPPYNRGLSKVFTARTDAEAWSDPFVAVYEPMGSESSHIRGISRSISGEAVVVDVARDCGRDRIISNIADKAFSGKSGKLDGSFAIVSVRPEEVEYYLGAGRELCVPADPALGTAKAVCISCNARSGECAASVTVCGSTVKVQSAEALTIKVGRKTIKAPAGSSEFKI